MSHRPNIPFSSLMGEWHWKQTYRRLYNEQNGQWLTPSELFTPHYSNIMANFISTSMSTNQFSNGNDVGFEIVELGGGRGTNAKALLDHLKNHHNGMYERLEHYTIYDTSGSLHDLQREVLINASPHADKVKLVHVDMMDIAEGTSTFLTPSDTPTAVISLELLDNLPHDKVARCVETHDILQAEVVPLDSTSDVVDLNTQHPYMEVFSPLSDPLLERIVSMAPSLYTPTISHGPRWIPSVACGVLMKLFECRPNSSIAFADFDWLPAPDLTNFSLSDATILAEPAVGDPLVTDMDGRDYPCYLTPSPDVLCDILFPTDFGRLVSFVKQFHITMKENDTMGEVSTSKQRDFLLRYGSDEVDKTRSWLTGYSPLVDDFGNCSILECRPM